MNTIPKKRIDNLIPMAIQVIKDTGIAVIVSNDGEPNKYEASETYSGYFSSFGADMVNTSPLATAIFCEDKSKESGGNSNSKEDRSKISEAILALMRKEEQEPTKIKTLGNKRFLSEYLLTFGGSIPTSIVYDVLASAIALKIALRTFKKTN